MEDLNQDPRLDSVIQTKARGLLDIKCNFSNCTFQDQMKIQDSVDPQPDSSIQLKPRGLLHMECDFRRTPYKRLKTTDLIKISGA